MSSAIRQVVKHNPLIKFPQRKPGGVVVKPGSGPAATSAKSGTVKSSSASSSVPYVPQKGTISQSYDSYDAMPSIYRRKPLSQAEQDSVSFGGASNYEAKPAKGSKK